MPMEAIAANKRALECDGMDKMEVARSIATIYSEIPDGSEKSAYYHELAIEHGPSEGDVSAIGS